MITYILPSRTIWGEDLRDYISERVITLAEYITEHKATVRAAAKKFGISKSTVHKDISERLIRLNPSLGEQVKRIMDDDPGFQSWVATREAVPPTKGMEQQMKPARQNLVGVGQHACSLLRLTVWIPAGEAVSSESVETWPWFLFLGRGELQLKC